MGPAVSTIELTTPSLDHPTITAAEHRANESSPRIGPSRSPSKTPTQSKDFAKHQPVPEHSASSASRVSIAAPVAAHMSGRPARSAQSCFAAPRRSEATRDWNFSAACEPSRARADLTHSCLRRRPYRRRPTRYPGWSPAWRRLEDAEKAKRELAAEPPYVAGATSTQPRARRPAHADVRSVAFVGDSGRNTRRSAWVRFAAQGRVRGL